MESTTINLIEKANKCLCGLNPRMEQTGEVDLSKLPEIIKSFDELAHGSLL